MGKIKKKQTKGWFCFFVCLSESVDTDMDP